MSVAATKPMKIEDSYRQMTAEQHLIERPDTWVGSVMPQEHENVWLIVDPVFKEEIIVKQEEGEGDSEPAPNVVEQPAPIVPATESKPLHLECLPSLSYSPAFFQIFNEILMNAADVDNVTSISVRVDPSIGQVTIENDGQPLPVHVHEKHGVQIVDMVFGSMFSGSNYGANRNSKKIGRNGIGGKSANLLSTEFSVTNQNAEQRLVYTQTWHDNMSRKANTTMRTRPMAAKQQESKTIIRFRPDAIKLHTPVPWSDDTVRLLQTRVYTLAATASTTSSLRVRWQSKLLSNRIHFDSFVKMHFTPSPTSWSVAVPSFVTPSWRVVFAFDRDLSGGNRSFVNSGETIDGGSHVNLVWKSWIVGPVRDMLMNDVQKSKALGWSKERWASVLKARLFMFVNAIVTDPEFNSQTKAKLTTPVTELTDAPIYDSANSEHRKTVLLLVRKIVTTLVVIQAESLERSLVASTDSTRRDCLKDIVKLHDAPSAGCGEPNALECTLILTEGDSAKALAIAGVTALADADRYGVFPLKGKFLNVGKSSKNDVYRNEEVCALKRILGLRDGVDYSNDAAFRTLRYGHVMLMADQDHDGSHIKGLVIWFFASFFPSLLRRPDYLYAFMTPIVKATRGAEKHMFYTVPQYLAFKEEQERSASSSARWFYKRYKGLGTSTNKDARDYFKQMDAHRKTMVYGGAECDRLMSMCFGSDHEDARKAFANSYVVGTCIDTSKTHFTFAEFVNLEFILYAVASNLRAIPSVCDSFKKCIRQIFFSARHVRMSTFERQRKVEEFAGVVSKVTQYEHGQKSVCEATIGQGQTFVGSGNTLNFFVPEGQFGTRLTGGDDAASERYVYTYTTPMADIVYPKQDDCLLPRRSEEGTSARLEPLYYAPIVPMAIINAQVGMGFGYSTRVPSHHPLRIVEWIEHWLQRNATPPPPPLTPWSRGFMGSIRPNDKQMVIEGCFDSDASTRRVIITELPLGIWTMDYKKKVLIGRLSDSIQSVVEGHSEDNVCFLLKMTSEWFDAHPTREQQLVALSLRIVQSPLLVFFDTQNKLRVYDSPETILREWCPWRLALYAKRVEVNVSKAHATLVMLEHQLRFVESVVNRSFRVFDMDEAEQAAAFERGRWPTDIEWLALKSAAMGGADAADDAAEASDEAVAQVDDDEVSTFRYLLRIPLLSCTRRQVDKLRNDIVRAREKWNDAKTQVANTVWRQELQAFREAWIPMEAADDERSKEWARNRTLAMASVTSSSWKSYQPPERKNVQTKRKATKRGRDGTDMSKSKSKAVAADNEEDDELISIQVE